MDYLDFFPAAFDAKTTIALSVAAGGAMVGMAIAFIVAEPKSAITRAFAVAYGASGLAIITEMAYIFLYPEGSPVPWFARFPVFVTIGTAAYPLWLLRLARTAQPTPRALRWITACVWLQWIGVASFFVLGGLYPDLRLHHFYLAYGHPGYLTDPGYWMFATPVLAATANLTLGGVILFTQRVDPAERRRALAFAVSFPFQACVFVLPAGYNLLVCLAGTLIFLVGAMRYNVMLGESALFMSRFLSPQVAQLVRRKGLTYTMQPQALDVTAVNCDLRGFTQFSQRLASDKVIALLNEYYDVVGAVVAEFGATVNNYAGDGILILIGAPLPEPAHAQRGLALARRVRAAALTVTRHWSGPENPLGVGIGVASGRITVGAIGSTSRMEYTAVGSTINLAARLCEKALDREILVGPRTVELAGAAGLESRGRLQFKGLGELAYYVVADLEPASSPGLELPLPARAPALSG
ncbi:MAG: adenylate/guanylate cyclase domain-containing protein [Stenotrophobium sp.]